MSGNSHAEMFEYVKYRLEQTGGEGRGMRNFAFRKRSEHINRVYAWARRLLIENECDDVDADAVLTAAIFHDSGYTRDNDSRYHAASGADVFAEYARAHNFDKRRAEFIEYLVRNHSRKDILTSENTPMELVLLMEADLLDETGAMSIVWDCLAEHANANASFESAFNHITSYTGRTFKTNYMRTPAARRFWDEKAALTRGFIESLARDIEFGI